MLIEKKISDSQLTDMLKENNFSAWAALYKKYSAAMYGLICNLTEDKEIANEILIGAFIELKTKNILDGVKNSLCSALLRFTNAYAVSELHKRGIDCKMFNPVEEEKLIYLLCIQCHSLQEVSDIFDISKEEVRKQLRIEILNLRNKKKEEPVAVK